MKKIFFKSIVWIFVIPMLVISCKEEDPSLSAPPTEADAVFTFEATATSDNIIELSNTSNGFLKRWDFGNGQTAEGDVVQVTYPFQGEYEVTLTVFTGGGSVSSKQMISIAETDLNLLKPVYSLLTGGSGNPAGKTWIIASSVSGHMGIGPADATSPIWWAAGPNEKSDVGLYDDKFVFKLNGFSFSQVTNGDVYVNNAQAGKFPGAYPNKGDQTAPYTAPTTLTWSITTNAAGHDVLTISDNGFIGYYVGSSSYEILSISESEMFIKFIDAAVPANAWFHRLVPDGFVPPSTTLPVDFEGTIAPPFNGFGGTAFSVVANPDASGINTSAKVGKYVKGMDGSWAGIETVLSAKLDFSTNSVVKYKVYSPVAGRALFKLEATDGAADPVEVFADVTEVNKWQELTFDFSGTPANTFNKIAMFLDFDNNAGGTFYVDDIRQAFVPAELKLADLTGATAKTWVLKPAAGSFGVGPAKGSDAYYPNGQNLSAERPCLFNDQFIFKTGGVYEYDAVGDIFGEQYMGLAANGCTDESNLPTAAQVWGSGTHSFVFTPASGGNPATIKVVGTGAFIALPKAYNGGEYAAAPPATDGSVTYEVLNYVKNGSQETLTLTIDISGNGTVFWNFVLIAQ